MAGFAVVGDIVLAPLSFTDLRDSKSRPVLVVADAGMHDWVVCQITSHQPGRPGEVAVTRQDMRSGRMDYDSWIRPTKLWTLNEQLLTPPVARLATTKLSEVLTAIRSLF